METLSIYRQIYNDLLEKIYSGHYAGGSRIPSENELSQVYGVSRITSKRALDLLAEQGIIIRYPGKGSFVNSNYPERGNSSLSRAIGFILPDFSDAFGTRLIYSIEENCKALGYQLLLRRTRDRPEEEEEAIRALSHAAGILLIPVHGELYNSELLKMIIDKRPLVFVDRKMRGLAAPTVATNNLEAAESGTAHLFRLGHRNIAFFSGPVHHNSTVEDRRQGYIQAHTKFAVRHNPAFMCQDLSTAWTGPYYSSESVSKDVDIAIRHLKKHPEISAAFTSEYIIALIIKDAAEALGKKIPADFSIITFDAPPSITEIPPITHIYQDEYAMGKESVAILHRLITQNSSIQNPSSDNPSSPVQDIQVSGKLVVGASTGPKTAGKAR